MFSQQLQQVIEDLPLNSFRTSNPDTVLDLDNMQELPDFVNPETQRTDLSGLEMDKKDLELLGFMVVEDDDPKQRKSRIAVTYTAQDDGRMKRNVQITPDEQAEEKSKDSDKGAFNLVYKEKQTLEQQMHSMDQSYQQYREDRLKAVSVKMTPDMFHQIQLNKLFKVAEIIQKKRVKDVMQRMLSFSASWGSDKTGSKMIKSGMREKQGAQPDMLSISKKQVDMYFNQWGEVFRELPQSLREDIMKLSRPKQFNLQERAINLEEQQQHMYLVVEGHALLFQNEYLFKKFNRKLESFQNRQKEKYQLISKPNFSNLVHVGTIILKYVQKNEIICHILARGKRRLEAKRAEEKIYEGDTGLIKLSPGSVFGDFQEANGRTYKPQQVVSMSEPLKCIMINRNDLKKLFSRILTQENLILIRGRISAEQMSHNIVKKILRCFNERVFPPGKILLDEGKALTSIYIIKSGMCEMYSSESPLKARNKTLKDKFFFKLPMSGEEISLGLNQGSMSKAFNYYPLSEVGQGTWLGEEAFYMGSGSKLSYSVKCKTMVKVLEIGLQDFEARMPKELTAELKNIAIRKQFMRYMRMQEIIRTSSHIKEKEELHEFHSRTLQSIIKMHPHASKQIIQQLGNQFQLEGFQRTARYRDAVNVGQIQAKEKATVSPFATTTGADATVSSSERQTTTKVTEESSRQGPNPMQDSGFLKKYSVVQIEKQMSVQALSPGGKFLPHEVDARQNLIDIKNEALAQANAKKMPIQVVQQFNKASTTKISPRHDEKLKLSKQKQEQLFGLGVDQNNQQMFSLATINSVPLVANGSSRSPSVRNEEDRGSPHQLKYDPTEAQLIELEKMLLQKKNRHPILEMRLQTAIKDRLAKKQTHVRSVPMQIFRSITFFNKDQAQLERAQDTEEKKQVFKLSKSVERLVTLQPQHDPNASFDDQLRHNQSSKQYFGGISGIPDSSQRLHQLRHNGNTSANNPFQKQQSSKFSTQSLSPMNKNRSGNQSTNLHTNPSLIASMGRSLSPFAKKLTQKQSCLYHAQKVSEKEIKNLQDIKHALHLHRSFQFKAGGMQMMQDSADPSGDWEADHIQQQQNLNQTKTSFNFGMINQHSSTIQIEPGMFDEEEERQLLQQPRQQQEQLILENNLDQYHGSQKQLGRNSSMKSQDTNVFRLDLSRISENQPVRKNSENFSLAKGKSSINKVKDHVRFELEAEHDRGVSRLEASMLKDLKEIDPRFEDKRLALLPKENNTAHNTDPLKPIIQPINEEEDGDVRYLEPPSLKPATVETTIRTPTEAGSVQDHWNNAEMSQSDNEKAFQEYLQVSRKNLLEEELRVLDEAKSEDLLHQPSEKVLSANHVSSDSHTSVLEAIDQTVTMYSNEKDAKKQWSQSWEAVVNQDTQPPIKESLENFAQDIKSNAAILNEMLSTRQKQIMKPEEEKYQKNQSLKAGSFKIKNLTTLKYVDQTSSTIQQMLSPSSMSPLRMQMARTRSPKVDRSQENSSKLAISKLKLKKSKNRYATIDVENQNSAEERLTQSVTKNLSGLKISQISLRHDKVVEPSKKSKASEGNRTENPSKLSHRSKKRSPSPTLLRDTNKAMHGESMPKESSLFKQPNLKFTKLATKQQNSSRRNFQSISGRKSPHESSKDSQKVPPDLAMVMDNSEINFKGKKSKLPNSRSPKASPPRTVKIDVTYTTMRKTMRLDQAATIFPSINQEENMRIKGTANYETYGDRNSQDVMDSTGTKYYISSHVPVTSQHSMNQEGQNNEALQMNVTYQNESPLSRKSKNAKNDYDVEMTTLLPAVTNHKVSNTNDHMNLQEATDKGTSRRQREREGDIDETSGDIIGGAADLDNGDSMKKMTSFSKIKVAIENNSASRRHQKNKQSADFNQEDYVKEEKQQTSTNFPPRKLVNLKSKRLKKDIFSKNAEAHFEQEGYTKQISPRVRQSAKVSPKQSPKLSGRRGEKERRNRHRNNDDLLHASIRGVNQSESKLQYEEMLRRSEQSSINKYNEGRHQNNSILSDIARQHFEYFSSQVAKQESEVALGDSINRNPPQSMEVVYSPKYKHMPVMPYKHVKHGGLALKYPSSDVQGQNQSTELPKLQSQQVSPTSSALALMSNKGAAIKESAYIKNQKWRTIESKKLLLQSGDQNKRRVMIDESDSNHPSNMNRGSSVRRSQIIQGRSNGVSLLSNEKAGSKQIMARQDSLMLPPSYSRVLHRSSKAGFAERQSIASLNSTTQVHIQSILRVLDDDTGDHPDRVVAGLSAAEQTKLKFQQIKEEKRRMQQQF